MFNNYGDINYFELGALVENDGRENEYHVLYCRPLCETDENGNELYYFADCFVDITDTWIDRTDVESFADCDAETSPELYAVACIDYYGAENFASPYDGYRFTRAEIIDKLNAYGITRDVCTF